MRRYLAVVTLIACLSSHATASVKDASWTARLEAPPSWQHVSMTGSLVVGTGSGLVGIDTNSGTVLWRHQDLVNVVADSVEDIPATPLVVLKQGDRDPRIVILNASDGTLVFDSRAENLVQILDKRVLPRTGGLLIAGFEAGQPQTTLFMYDIASGKRRWRSDVLHQGSSRLVTLLSAVVASTQQISPLSSGPLELADGSFLLAASGKILRLRADDGRVVWRESFPWGSPQIYLSDGHPDRVFIGAQVGGEEYMEGTRSVYQSLNLADGKALWDSPTQVSGAFNPHLVFLPQGLVISEHTQGGGRMRLLDYASGESRWGKKGRGLKIKGGIVAHSLIDDQLVITTGFDNAWNDKGTEYLLYVVDTARGTLRFKKPLLVRGQLRYTMPIANGVLYATTHEVNVLDPASGKRLNEATVKSKRTVVATRDARALYAFSQDDGLIHRLDLGTGRLVKFSRSKVKLEAGDTPQRLEKRGDNLVLLGQQSVASWNPTGEVMFTKHHRAPKRHGVMRALLYAQAVRSAAASFASGVYAAGFAAAANETAQGSLGREITTGMSDGYAELSEGYAGLAGDSFNAARERFQASARSRDFLFMMVRQDNKRLGLAQVSKDTGDIVSVIDLGREREPNYQVDDIGNLVFHQTDRSVIAAYQF